MKKHVLRTDGRNNEIEVGDDYQAWNAAIGASTGEIVRSLDGSIELWCDENGGDCELNRAASIIVGMQIVGDVIVFYPGDIK
jgi:hypothetical protein